MHDTTKQWRSHSPAVKFPEIPGFPDEQSPGEPCQCRLMCGECSNFEFSSTKNLIRVATWTAVVGSEWDADVINTWANVSHVRTGFRAGRSVFWQHRLCSPVSSAGTSATTSVSSLTWIATITTTALGPQTHWPKGTHWPAEYFLLTTYHQIWPPLTYVEVKGHITAEIVV